MLEWLAANIGTIIVALIVIAVIAFVVARMVKDKKEGKSSCGANCAHCACPVSYTHLTLPTIA